jgi:hypothetical protein
MLAIGWAGALKLGASRILNPGDVWSLHQVGERLLIDHRKKHFADDPIVISECRLRQTTQ